MAEGNGLRLSIEDQAYAWRQLAVRAGITQNSETGTGFEETKISVHYGNPDAVTPTQPAVIVVPCAPDAGHALIKREPHTLSTVPFPHTFGGYTPPIADKTLPVLFWGQGYENNQHPFVEQRIDGTVIFYADILAATFFMLTRWEEIKNPCYDQHGRYPAEYSVAFRQAFLERPVVDEYALILRAWLVRLVPHLSFKQHDFRVFLTHDVDSPIHWPNLWHVLRSAAGNLVLHRDISRLISTLMRGFKAQRDRIQDPYVQGLRYLMHVSESERLSSSFYVMAAFRSGFDNGYDPGVSPYSEVLAEISERNHPIGFHPGYYTFLDAGRFAQELSRLRAVVDMPIVGGRQHYLRFRVPDTWQTWEDHSLEYDSTLGFADHIGFRAGTCHPFHPYDIGKKKQFRLWERPLIVMDASLIHYMQLLPIEGQQRILEIARRCRAVEGEFVLLWHNSSLSGSYKVWRSIYTETARILSKWLYEKDT